VSFLDLQRTVLRATRLNTAFFAQACIYETGTGDDERQYQIPIHCRHRRREEERADGTVLLWEVLDVEIERTTDPDYGIPNAPQIGDRITHPDGTPEYLYAYAGKHRAVSWVATFQRRAVAAQGVRGGR
jgi:hypothetical protein